MKIVLPHLFLSLSLILSACNKGNPTVSRSLDRIESLVEEHSDSALLELERLDSLMEAVAVRIDDEQQQARYALLKTQTHDKNYIDETNDSLIQTAVRYYDEHGDEHKQMLAHFYLGSIRRNAQRYADAFTTFGSAEQLALRADDTAYRGMSFMNLSLVCRMLGSVDAIAYADSAQLCFQLLDDSLRIAQAMVYKATALSYYKRSAEAQSLFEQVLATCSDMQTRNACLQQYIGLCVTTGQYTKADELFAQLGAPRTFMACVNRIYVDVFHNDTAQANIDAAQARELICDARDSVFYYAALRNICLLNVDYQGAYHALARKSALQDSIVREVSSNSVAAVQKQQLRLQNEHIRHVAAQRQQKWIFVSIIVLLLISAAVCYVLLKRREQQRTIDSFIEKASYLQQTLLEQSQTIESLQDKVKLTEEKLLDTSIMQQQAQELNAEMQQHIDTLNAEMQQRVDSLNAEMQQRDEMASTEMKQRREKHLLQIKKLFTKSFHELDLLCSSYYENQGKIDEQRIIYTKVCDLINDFSKPRQQQKLDEIINENFDQLMQKVKTPEIGLTEMELQLFRFKMSGFSIRSICLFTNNDNPQAIKKRIQRLKTKILTSDSPYSFEIAALL